MDKVLAPEVTAPGSPPQGFRAGVEDIVILPMVAIAFAVKAALRGLLRVLIAVIDGLFPVLLQAMRLPLLAIRILGEGVVALLNGVAATLPIGEPRRRAMRQFISRNWAWLRRYLSYRVFEEWLHHVFENGMTWVFRKCRRLTPRAALMVIVGAILWLPISFAAATFLHALLLARATSLPPWMQLLHPVVTLIAKSKLLVLPVYPAAWPQARQHPIVQAMIRSWRGFTTLYLVQKTGFRYRQTELAAARAAEACLDAASAIGAIRVLGLLRAGINAAATTIGRGLRMLLAGVIATLAPLPLFDRIVRRLAEHYEEMSREPAASLSAKAVGFFARWSIRFSAEYYEAKERENDHPRGIPGMARRQ